MQELLTTPDTLLHPIAQRCDEAPDAIAIETAGRPALSYAQLMSQVSRVVEALNEVGVGRNDRVSIVLPPGPELATLSLSVMAGATAAPLNHEYKLSEYRAAFERLQPRLLVTLANPDTPAREAAEILGIPVAELSPDERTGTFALRIETGGASPRQSGFAKPEDDALVLETSGTTSLARTVPLSQRNLWASSQNVIHSLALDSNDRCLHVLPLFHIGGLVDVLAAPLSVGGSVVCTAGFSVPEFFRNLGEFSPTWSQAVPTMLRELVDHAGDHRDVIEANRFRLLRSVSAPLPMLLLEDCERVFATSVIEIYGMTETAGVITSNPLGEGRQRPGSVGTPAGCEVAILAEGGNPVGPETEGEVCVRGANVMSGYQQAPEENARAFCDSWFRTGDLGYRDRDGYLFLTGRLKEIINRGGEKIAPRELDDLLLRHPDITDAAVFAMPHASLGEDIAAAVVVRDGAMLSTQDVVDFLRPDLAYFKIPRVVHFVPEIPRSGGGKLQRSTLAETFGHEDPESAVPRRPYVAPKSPIARLLVEMWQEALEIESIGIHDNFFELGGDSLCAATLVNEIQQRWGAIVYVSSLFDAPTVEELETCLHEHYPELVVKMLGHVVNPSEAKEPARVDAEKLSHLRQIVARLSPAPGPCTQRNPQAAFILATPRSGSTLLRAMLGGSPGLFAPPELFLLSFDDLAARRAWFAGSQEYLLEGNLRCVMQLKDASVEEAKELVLGFEEKRLSTRDYFAQLQHWVGDRLLIDKTPFNSAHPESLRRAEVDFEDALFIHLVRHPYGMIRSFEEAKLDQLWYPRLVGREAAARTPFPFETREFAEMIWLMLHQNISEFLREIPKHRQIRVHFEDLVRSPRAEIEALCDFLAVDFEGEMLRPQSNKKERMTDGIYPVSRMIGDMKFHQHEDIDPDVADLWKQHYQRDFLCDATRSLAQALGYDETVASSHDREEFVI